MKALEDCAERAFELGEIGFQVAAYVGDELVVDMALGTADMTSGRPVDAETLFPIFSVGKAFVSTALHIQAERGLVDYDAAVAKYWPEFGAHGKDRITVHNILCHRAGAPQMPPDVTPTTLGDWHWVVGRIAELEPLYPPDSTSAYQSMSYGFILGEIVRRTDPKQRSFSQFVYEEICEPLEIDGFFMGVPDRALDRVAPLYRGAFNEPGEGLAPLRSVTVPRAVRLAPEVWNLPEMIAACAPATNSFANARSVAKLFAVLAGAGRAHGVRLLSTSRVRSFGAHRPDPYGIDLGVGRPLWVGIGGFWLGGPHPPAGAVIGTSPNVLAHGGAGGSYAWADPDLRLAAAITHNKMSCVDNPPTPVDIHPFIPFGDALRDMARELLA